MRPDGLGITTALDALRLYGAEITVHGRSMLVRTDSNPYFHNGNLVLSDWPAGSAELTLFEQEFPYATHRTLWINGDLPAPAFSHADFSGGDLPGGDAFGHGLRLESTLTMSATASATGAAPPGRIPAVGHGRLLESDGDWLALAAQRCADTGTTAEADDDGARFCRTQTRLEHGISRRNQGAGCGWFVDGALVASLILLRLPADRARVEAVMTDPAHRRQGIAAALLGLAMAHARTYWRTELFVLDAEPDGPAAGIYRRLGFTDAGWVTSLTGENIR
ncbi:GNAT family N-acetyltransferase [Micrococcaceae bacterium Sec5.7]